jgi:signal transduction histidine kinase/CheY-like chemotaxis protein
MAENSASGSGLRLIRVAAAASILLPAVLLVWVGVGSYKKVQALAEERIVHSLDIEEEHANKSFQIVNLILDDLTEDLLSSPPEGREQYFHDLFLKRIRAASEIQSIWLYDQDGRAIATSSVFPAPRERSFRDQDYFRAHVGKDAGTYFGEVHDSTFGGKPFFTISRRIVRDGAFAGVLEVSVLPSEFYAFYTRLVYSEGLQYALIREDGAFLVRYPVPNKMPPPPLDPSTAFRRTIAADPQGGFYRTVSAVDGIRRLFAVRRLAGAPVYVTAGITTDAIDREWLAELFPYIGIGLPGAAFLFATLMLVLHGAKRLDTEMQLREQAEASLRQAQRLDAIGQLTGGVAHDFNNLLTIIIGNLESAGRQVANVSGAGKDRLDQAITRAMQGAQRAATLTRRLLAFSRQQPLNPKALNLNKILAGLPDLLRGGLDESVSVEVVGAGGLWPVETDATELETAIVNLAVNARDAMPDGGKLTIEASNSYLDETYCRQHTDVQPGQYVSIAVTDNGSGMPAEVMARAFEPFFTTKEAGQGTGLGLSQVYGFVKQSGGHLNIYSEVGEGTTVKIYLPRLLAGTPEEDAPAPIAAADASGECILLVEDDDDVRAYLSETLRSAHYRVIEAADAEKAIEALDARGAEIDLLLTDVVMPGMNGRRLAEEAKARRPNLKVVFMTGYSRNAIVHQGRLDSGVDLLQKPITAEQLATKIRTVLDKK